MQIDEHMYTRSMTLIKRRGDNQERWKVNSLSWQPVLAAGADDVW